MKILRKSTFYYCDSNKLKNIKSSNFKKILTFIWSMIYIIFQFLFEYSLTVISQTNEYPINL